MIFLDTCTKVKLNLSCYHTDQKKFKYAKIKLNNKKKEKKEQKQQQQQQKTTNITCIWCTFWDTWYCLSSVALQPITKYQTKILVSLIC